MATANELLFDEAVRHQIALAGYSNQVVRRIIALLNRSDDRLYAELVTALASMDADSFTVQRLEALLGSFRALNAQAYAQVGLELRHELRDFLDYEVQYQAQALRSVLPAVVSVASVSAETAYAAALARPFQGLLLSGALADLEADKAKRVRIAIAQGFSESKTTAQIVREIRGTKAKGYADGIWEIDRRNAQAIVRTALGHMAGFAADRSNEANEDIIKAVRWSATLDLRTSEICRIRDSKLYEPVTHKPVGHSLPWLGGPRRAHWNCRSFQVPILKSFRELGIDLDGSANLAGDRASLDGQVPKEVSFSDWIKRQSASRQNEVLGPTRGALLRNGGLSLEDLYSTKGVYKTLDDLRQSDARAFAKAGL